MQYQNIRKATFLDRPNRFVAHAELDGKVVVCHVKNTGRCRELLLPGTTIYVQAAENPARKTPFDLIAVEKGERLINMDAQAPNRVFQEWAEQGKFREGLTLLRPETTWGNSRFDFYWEAGERKGFVEVKGVTLEEEGIVRFPDAPTERGVKHLTELARCRSEGLEASICFVIQMEQVRCFTPNERTHPAFGQALRAAAEAGVEVLAYDCRVAPDRLELRQPVPVVLNGSTEKLKI